MNNNIEITKESELSLEAGLNVILLQKDYEKLKGSKDIYASLDIINQIIKRFSERDIILNKIVNHLAQQIIELADENEKLVAQNNSLIGETFDMAEDELNAESEMQDYQDDDGNDNNQ